VDSITFALQFGLSNKSHDEPQKLYKSLIVSLAAYKMMGKQFYQKQKNLRHQRRFQYCISN
jgi:hypothetical protein